MYKRIETIEEECLDWGKHPVAPLEEMDEKIAEAVIPPVSKQSKIFLNERASLRGKFSIKRKFTNLLDENSELFLVFSILALPYIVGFVLSYFLFYFYGGMTIGSFFSIQQGQLSIELWSIGAYLFVTVWVIWIVLTP